MKLEALYLKLPRPLQDLAVSLEGWRIQRRRFDAEFHRLLGEAEARSRWRHDEVVAFRDERLRELVCHAARTVPYYRRLFRDLGVSPADIRTLEDLAALPVLTKPEVQGREAEFRSERSGDEPSLRAHTSGSTGAGLVFEVSAKAHKEQWAIWWRYRRWHGIDLGEPCLYFGGRALVPSAQRTPPYWRRDLAGRRLLFSAYHLGPETAAAYLDAVRRSGFRWIHGYPSLVALLAEAARDAGGVEGVEWVTLGAEDCRPFQARAIREGLGVSPLDHYGMAEGVANFSRCPEGRYHVDEDFAAVEFLATGEGRTCRVVGTSLGNRAHPFLRYEVGDLVELSADPPGSCACGMPGRLVDRVLGRAEDIVVTRSGKRLGRLDHMFKDATTIREAQIVQLEPGRIVIRIVPGPGHAPVEEQRIRDAFERHIGEDLEIQFQEVQEIPRTRAGKIRFVTRPESGAPLEPA